jgi:putrescine transport system permease protein
VTGAGTRTLPIYIYDQAHTGVKPEINAICTVWMIVVALAVACASFMIQRSRAGQERMATLAAMP